MDALRAFEIHQTTRHHIPEDLNIHLHRCDNLKSSCSSHLIIFVRNLSTHLTAKESFHSRSYEVEGMTEGFVSSGASLTLQEVVTIKVLLNHPKELCNISKCPVVSVNLLV